MGSFGSLRAWFYKPDCILEVCMREWEEAVIQWIFLSILCLQEAGLHFLPPFSRLPSMFLTLFLCVLESCWWTVMDFLGSGFRKALFYHTASGRWPNSSRCNELNMPAMRSFIVTLKKKTAVGCQRMEAVDRTLTLARLRSKNESVDE